MALNNVRFNTTAGGLGRLPDGSDHISAIIMDVTPSGWAAGTVAVKYLSVAEAEADGIVSTDSATSLLHYFISEYFRMAGPSELYVVDRGVAGYNAQAFYTATNGEVRQAFEYDESNYAAIATKVGAMQAFATSLEALHAPLSVITNVKDETTNISSTVTDLIQVNAPKVSVVAFGSGSGTAAALATALGVKYVPAGGTVLGILANASVHENIGHVARFPLADDTEFTSVVLSDGQDVRSIAETTLVALDDRGYIFGVTHNGIAGTYCHDSVTAVAATSDFAYIENNRTIDKAKRQIRSALLPDLNAPLTVNADGTLALDTVRYFETLTERPLTLMQNAGEVSNFSVVIDPEQNVLSTSKLVIQVKIQPRGIARQIEVNIGYAVSL